MPKKKKVICQNCGSDQMKKGKVTTTAVMQYTEYHCVNGCNVWSEATPLPGHEPVVAEVASVPEEPEKVQEADD